MKVFFAILMTSLTTFAFIPKGLTILQKTAENNGSGAYTIEQEVQFSTDAEPLVLKETWQVENSTSMKLTVTGTKELKDLLKMQFVYSGGQRSSLVGNSRQTKKMNEDFIEKYFYFRSGETFADQLIQMKIVPNSILYKKTVRSTKDFDNRPEDFVRLSRVGGVVAYAFGPPALPEASENSAGFWIEQDQFVLRKFRLPSGVEVSAEKFSQYARGLNFPRKRTIRWDNNTVQVQTLSVAVKATGGITGLEATRLEPLDSLPVKSQVLDFYARFR